MCYWAVVVGYYVSVAVSIFTGNPYFTSEMFYNQLADGEPKPAALGILVEFLESVEEGGLLLGSNAASGVGHGKQSGVLLHLQ